MEVTVSGQVGPQKLSDGSEAELRMGRTRELIVSHGHPDYYEAAGRGLMYSAANQAAQAISVALATTYTGILLFNPVNSGKVLVPTFLKFALSVAPAGIAPLGLIQGYAATGGVTAQTAALTVQNNQIGNSAKGVGIALSQATIVTPTWLQMLADGFTAASFPAPTLPVDLRGQYSILPGAFIALGALTAVTGLGSISWEEIDL